LVFAAIRDAIADIPDTTFRVLHFSVQQDHFHAIVEADSHEGLTKGIRGLVIRMALAVKRAARVGKLWGDRYHARALRTPREVRHAIVYCSTQLQKASSGERGHRSPQFGPLVRRLEATAARARRSESDVSRSNLAGCNRLALPRSHRLS